jgi:hypothetical protein
MIEWPEGGPITVTFYRESEVEKVDFATFEEAAVALMAEMNNV